MPSRARSTVQPDNHVLCGDIYSHSGLAPALRRLFPPRGRRRGVEVRQALVEERQRRQLLCHDAAKGRRDWGSAIHWASGALRNRKEIAPKSTSVSCAILPSVSLFSRNASPAALKGRERQGIESARARPGGSCPGQKTREPGTDLPGSTQCASDPWWLRNTS